MFKCYDCDFEFEEPNFYEEKVGEFWGSPAYKKFYICPNCGSDAFDEIQTVTNEEAKNELKEMWVEFDYTLHDKAANAIDVALEALEKQIPKKMIYEYDGYADGVPVYDMAQCPNCGAEFYEDENGWESTYCPDCGQRLVWGE